MPISANVEIAKTREKIQLVDDQPYVGREYIGSAPKPGSADYGKAVAGDGSPQAYLVMQPPGSVTRPHFHQTNQFQVFVGGGGTGSPSSVSRSSGSICAGAAWRRNNREL